MWKNRSNTPVDIPEIDKSNNAAIIHGSYQRLVEVCEKMNDDLNWLVKKYPLATIDPVNLLTGPLMEEVARAKQILNK